MKIIISDRPADAKPTVSQITSNVPAERYKGETSPKKGSMPATGLSLLEALASGTDKGIDGPLSISRV